MNANTPQGTGAMTLDEAVTHMTGKLAERGATVDDTAINHPADPDDEAALGSLPEGTEGQEQTADAEDNAEAVSDDESEAETQEPDTRPIILPDGSEITVEEARKGYLRQADFTRKTQALAQEREGLAAREQAAVQQLGGLYQQLASLQETEPTPAELYQLRQKDPAKYEEVKAYWDYRRPIMQKAQQVIQQQQANALQVAQTKARQSLIASDNSDSPWKGKSENDLDAGLDKIGSYMRERFPGVPGDVLSSLTFPEAFIIIEESRQFRELQKAKPKAALAVKGKPAPFKPGAKSTASPQSEQIRLLDEAFRRNPTVENATALHMAKAARRQTRR
jgi:hypothetical protein